MRVKRALCVCRRIVLSDVRSVSKLAASFMSDSIFCDCSLRNQQYGFGMIVLWNESGTDSLWWIVTELQNYITKPMQDMNLNDCLFSMNAFVGFI
jgi:hypothetical protein